MMWAVGSLLTVLLGIAGFFSLRQFDRQIKFTALSVAAEQRVEFERRLETDLKKLEMKNSKQVSDSITKLTLKINLAQCFDSGLIFAALKDYEQSVENFRSALELYVSKEKPADVEKDLIILSICNLFRSMQNQDKDHFRQNAQEELKSEIYKKLDEELVLAAPQFLPLGKVLPKRKET